MGYVTDDSGQIWDVNEDGRISVWSEERQQWLPMGTPETAIRLTPRTVTRAELREKERAAAQQTVQPDQERAAMATLAGTGSLYRDIVRLEHTPRGSGKLAGEFAAIRYERQAAVDKGLAAAHLQSIDEFDDAVRALRVVVARRSRVIALDTLNVSEQILREALGRYPSVAECNRLATLLRPFRQGRPPDPQQFLRILDAHRILMSPVALHAAVAVEIPDLLRDVLLQNAEAQLGNVTKTRERLAEDPDLVLEFDEVVGQALEQMGAGADSVQAQVIRDGRTKPGKSWKRELLDGILLVLSFALGPIGWAARAAQLVVTVHDSAANAAHLDDLRAASHAGVPLATAPPQGSGSFLEAAGIIGGIAGVLHVPAGPATQLEGDVAATLDRAPPVPLGPRRAVLKDGTEVFDPPRVTGASAATPRAARPPIDLAPDPATGHWSASTPAQKPLPTPTPRRVPAVTPAPRSLPATPTATRLPTATTAPKPLPAAVPAPKALPGGPPPKLLSAPAATPEPVSAATAAPKALPVASTPKLLPAPTPTPEPLPAATPTPEPLPAAGTPHPAQASVAPGALPESQLLSPPRPLPSTTAAMLSAGDRTAEVQKALARAQTEADSASDALRQAHENLATAKGWQVETPGADAKALVDAAQTALATARSEAARLERGLALARGEAAEVSRATESIAELERVLVDIRARLRAQAETTTLPSPTKAFGQRARFSDPRPGDQGFENFRDISLALERTTTELAAEVQNLNRSIQEQLRRAAPGEYGKDLAMTNLRELAKDHPVLAPVNDLAVDVTTGGPMSRETWQADHIMSRSEIGRDPRFSRLTPLQRDEILNEVPQNYLPLRDFVNEHVKRGLTVEQFIQQHQPPFPADVAAALRAADQRARAAIEAKFRQFLGE
ncbi:hypothetical protein ACFWUU_12865 [Kribbella sp. NPDC058693]|uniref:hypothetical protein n=1 Tax=Kribbella sp. NPDC058693 TaxID=3346602 RepID=UPI0036498AAF